MRKKNCSKCFKSTFLFESGIEDAKIGRGAPVDNFLIYAKWALKKVQVKEVN